MCAWRMGLILFLLTPLREGRPDRQRACAVCRSISTHAPAGGATLSPGGAGAMCSYFYSRPCGRGDVDRLAEVVHEPNFYSRPCGRGDSRCSYSETRTCHFYSRPCGRGDRGHGRCHIKHSHFYSRPCGRGDTQRTGSGRAEARISTHAPAGGATGNGWGGR